MRSSAYMISVSLYFGLHAAFEWLLSISLCG